MARKKMSYSERARYWRRVEYVALGVMIVATVVLVAALFM